ncbi:HlyD family secretion protein [Brucella abortus]|uniref:HlyD family secretion protein n=1 Tax=Brucella abortus TaxID=235 RepID=UPI00046CF215|nr:HlyD family secretion protein [Brucella abortus]
MAETNTSPSPAQDQSPKHPMLRRILLIVGPVVAIAIGLWIYFSGGQYVSEDDSYVGAAAVAITPQVSGQVIRVAVGPNQPVKEGDLLFEIDPQPFQIELDQAKANLAQASEKLAGLVLTYKQQLASVAQAKDDVTFAQEQFNRVSALVHDKFEARAQFDQAERALQVAKQEQNAAASAAAATLAQLGGTLDKPLQQHASYLAAKAEVELAERNVRLTRVLAPFAGTVTQVENIQLGSFLAVGDPAFTLIGADAWVNSNIKETDLTHIKVGDPATVVLDSYLDQPLQGEVQSITPASGSVFALLPAQNASGNWVKVVQRMPVRIKITKPHPDVVMRDGGSATVTINTGYHRTFATLWRDLTGMVGID